MVWLILYTLLQKRFLHAGERDFCMRLAQPHAPKGTSKSVFSHAKPPHAKINLAKKIKNKKPLNPIPLPTVGAPDPPPHHPPSSPGSDQPPPPPVVVAAPGSTVPTTDRLSPPPTAATSRRQVRPAASCRRGRSASRHRRTDRHLIAPRADPSPRRALSLAPISHPASQCR